LTTWLASIPEPTTEIPEPFVEFTGPANDGRLIKLRLSVKPAVVNNASINLRTIEVTRFLGTKMAETKQYTIDLPAFKAGKWPKEFLRWPNEDVSQAEKYAAYRFFYGMPRPRKYNPGKTRHLFTPLREDAFRCQLAASQVSVIIASQTAAENKLRYRKDLWLSDQIPFGIAQVETSVYDEQSNQLLSRQTLIVTNASSGMKAESSGKP